MTEPRRLARGASRGGGHAQKPVPPRGPRGHPPGRDQPPGGRRQGASLLERAIFAVLSPLQRGVAASVRGVTGACQLLRGPPRGARGERAPRRSRWPTSRPCSRRSRTAAREAERLREILGLREILPLRDRGGRGGRPRRPALVPHHHHRSRGASTGWPLNAPVISPTGVVGRVIAVGPRAAKVQLLLDRESRHRRAHRAHAGWPGWPRGRPASRTRRPPIW